MAKIGKYVVTGEVARGAAYVVYSTLDPDVGRPVAVKTLAKALARPDDIARLKREAQVGGQLNHGHIAAVYEYGEDEYAAWLAMEMVEARPLAEHLAEGYRAPAEPLPDLIVELLEALEYAHSRGATHGDVRAENVLVSAAGAKLIGFGGAGAASDDVAAAAKLLRSVLAEPAAALDEPPATARELLEALRLKKPRPGARALPAVLFVDDEENALHALAGLFRGRYDVRTARSGAEALALLRERRFHVIVSDQRMPDMSGVEVLRGARTVAPTAVRLLLTGYSDFGAIVGSVDESEIFRYITKPWHEAELAATVGEAVEVAIAAEAAAAGGRRFDEANGNVVVLGQPALARSVRELSLGALGVQEAYDDETVVDIVSHDDIGVVVCELRPGSADPGALLRLLQRASPHTQVVAISERLEPQIDIHRHLAKPVNLSLLQDAVVSGLRRYSRREAPPRRSRRRLLERVRSLRFFSARAAAQS